MKIELIESNGLIFLWIETGNSTNSAEQWECNTCSNTPVMRIFSLDICLIQIVFPRKITIINRSVSSNHMKKKKKNTHKGEFETRRKRIKRN